MHYLVYRVLRTIYWLHGWSPPGAEAGDFAAGVAGTLGIDGARASAAKSEAREGAQAHTGHNRISGFDGGWPR